MTLVCGSAHPSPPLTMPRTRLHGKQGRLQHPHGGLNWQVSQGQRIPPVCMAGTGILSDATGMLQCNKRMQ